MHAHLCFVPRNARLNSAAAPKNRLQNEARGFESESWDRDESLSKGIEIFMGICDGHIPRKTLGLPSASRRSRMGFEEKRLETSVDGVEEDRK